MSERIPIEPSIIARVSQGVRYAVSGVVPSGWMSPAQPIQPVAQSQAVGRAYDYPVGINTQFQTKTADASTVTFAQLRGLADSLDILRLVIESRKDRLAAIDWEIVAADGKNVGADDLKKLNDLFSQPSPDHDWSSWLRLIAEDLFVIDAVAIYPRLTRGGVVTSFDVIDGALIKRVIDDQGRTPVPPDPAYQQILKGVPAADYTGDQLVYAVRNARSNRLYGYSQVEQIITTVNIAIRKQLTQIQYYTEGNIPHAFMSAPPEWSAEDLAAFQKYFDSLQNSNTSTKTRLLLVPMDATKIKEMRDPSLKDDFDEWLARIVCYAFSVPPTPFIRQMNRSVAESAVKVAAEEGLQPLLMYVSDLINRRLIRKFLRRDDVKFVWREKPSVDAIVQAQIDQIYVASGIRSADEIRLERGWSGQAQQKTTLIGDGNAPPIKDVAQDGGSN